MTSEKLLQLSPKLTREEAITWSFHFGQNMSKFNINTPEREAQFFAQVLHESAGLTKLIENLNYSSERLLVVFPKYFKNKIISDQYHRQPEKIANRVYANRMGNGSEGSGDGWKFRGRGPIQITGKDMYLLLGARHNGNNQIFIDNPDLLTRAEYGAWSACWLWQWKGCNELKDIEAITKKINGGTNGLEDRKEWYDKLKTTV